MPRPSYHALFIHQSPADTTAACIATEPNRINHGMTALLFFPRYVFQDDCLPPLPPLRVPPPGHRRLCLRIRRITYHFRLFPIYFDRALPKKKSPLISSTIRVGTPKETEGCEFVAHAVGQAMPVHPYRSHALPSLVLHGPILDLFHPTTFNQPKASLIIASCPSLS